MRRLLCAVGLVALAAVLCVYLPVLALAQDATVPATASTVVDFTPTVKVAEDSVFTVLALLITWLAHRGVALVSKYVSVTAADSMRALIDTAISRGIAWAQHELDGKLAGKTQFDVRNALAASALQYVQDKVPDALSFFGITPDTLQQRITAEITKLLPPEDPAPTVAAAAPAA